MTNHSIAPLFAARIWVSGSIPDEADQTSMRLFIGELADKIFRAGGNIIHGSHPTIWPVLLEKAEAFQAAGGSRDCLTLATSRWYSKKPEQHGIRLDQWREHAIVQEVAEVNGEKEQAESLVQLRRWIVDRCDAVILVGGKWWEENPGSAGVPFELELARERGLPCFVLAGFEGAVAGYLDSHLEVLRDLKNGLDEATNHQIATENRPDRLVELVLKQLCRLPLVRGQPVGGASFRILTLDGGGIKGTFTASALAEWEHLTGRRIVDHFDMIAGTSTGGILALGLGMGLSAAEVLNFYETRGMIVFPVTSLGGKLRYGVRALFQPKFAQEVLRRELESAFGGATRRTMRQSLCRLVIPACHARSGTVHLFRTNHHPDVIADRDLVAAEVAVATAAAPTYFRAAEVNDQSYVDGGVWANNPTMAALVEAVARLNVPINHIDVLSVGTTSEPYSGSGTLTSGLAGWAWNARIINLLMYAQAQGTAELASSLAGRTRLLRVDQTLVPGKVSLDKVTEIPELRDHGRQAAGHADTLSQVRQRFLNGIAVEGWTPY